MARQRALRVGDEIKRVLSQVILRDMKDPRIPPFTAVTEVEMSNDLSVATCYVSVLGSDRQQQECIAALQKAAGFLKRQIMDQIRLRIAPELRFTLDSSVEDGMRMDRLIDGNGTGSVSKNTRRTRCGWCNEDLAREEVDGRLLTHDRPTNPTAAMAELEVRLNLICCDSKLSLKNHKMSL